MQRRDDFVGPVLPQSTYIHPNLAPPSVGARALGTIEKSPYEDLSAGGFFGNALLDLSSLSGEYGEILNNPQALLEMLANIGGELYTGAQAMTGSIQPLEQPSMIAGMAQDMYQRTADLVSEPGKTIYETPFHAAETITDVAGIGGGLKMLGKAAVKQGSKKAAKMTLDEIWDQSPQVSKVMDRMEKVFQTDWETLGLARAELARVTEDGIQELKAAGVHPKLLNDVRKHSKQLEMSAASWGGSEFFYKRDPLRAEPGLHNITGARAIDESVDPIRLHGELGELFAEKANVKKTAKAWKKEIASWQKSGGRVQGEDVWNSGILEYLESAEDFAPNDNITGAQLASIYADRQPLLDENVFIGSGTHYYQAGGPEGIQDPRHSTPSRILQEGPDSTPLNPDEDVFELYLTYDPKTINKMDPFKPRNTYEETMAANFRNPAWDETGNLADNPKRHADGPVIGFIRGRFVYDADGRKVLLIDNIQSDLHQWEPTNGFASYRPKQLDLLTLSRSWDTLRDSLGKKLDDIQASPTETAIQRIGRSSEMNKLKKQISDLDTLQEMLARHASGLPEPSQRFAPMYDPQQSKLMMRVKELAKKTGEKWRMSALQRLMDDPQTKALNAQRYVQWRENLDPDIYAMADKHHFFDTFAPDAPFKKNWEKILMKRAMSWAVQHGADGLAWTPGWVQNARWGNKKFFDQLYDRKTVNGVNSILKDFGKKVKVEKRPIEMAIAQKSSDVPSDMYREMRREYSTETPGMFHYKQDPEPSPGYQLHGYARSGPPGMIRRDENWVMRHSPADEVTGEPEWAKLTDAEKEAGGRKFTIARGYKVEKGVAKDRDIPEDIRAMHERIQGGVVTEAQKGPYFGYATEEEAMRAALQDAWYVDLTQDVPGNKFLATRREGLTQGTGEYDLFMEYSRTLADWIRDHGMSKWAVIPPAAGASQFGNRE